MSTLPPIKRLVIEDYPADVRKWLGKLLTPLNDFMDAVYAALNRGLTLKENLAADMRTVELDGQMPLKISWSLKPRPRAVLVGAAYRSDGASEAWIDAVSVRWSFTQEGLISIDQVVGLSPDSSDRYKLELVIFTG